MYSSVCLKCRALLRWQDVQPDGEEETQNSEAEDESSNWQNQHVDEVEAPRSVENQIENAAETSTSGRPEWLNDASTQEAIRRLDLLFDDPEHSKVNL